MRASLQLLVIGILTVLTFTSLTASAGLQIPDYERVELDNGLTLLLMERSTVPMVDLQLWIDAGAIRDPQGKAGLATLTARALRRGAGDRDAETFAEAVDFLGANLSTRVDLDATIVGLQLLTKDLAVGLELMADAVLRPRLDATEIEKLSKRMSDEVTQGKDNPRFVLTDYHRAHLYGDHPYGTPVEGTETTTASLTEEDVRAFHAAHYVANRAILAVAGDFDLAEVREALERTWSVMPRSDTMLPKLPSPDAPNGHRVLLVNKTDTPQTWFTFGNLGPSWDEPDFAATELVRTIFGGRFTSWLNQKLRIESGLSYGAGYTISRGRVAGPAYIRSFTAKETTKEAIDAALGQLDRLHDDGVGQDDLASAKAYYKGQEPYEYETAGDLAVTICHLEFYGLSRDHIDDLFARIDAVTLEDCRRVVSRWFRRDDLVFTCVGVADEVADVLSAYGPVTVRENSADGYR